MESVSPSASPASSQNSGSPPKDRQSIGENAKSTNLGQNVAMKHLQEYLTSKDMLPAPSTASRLGSNSYSTKEDLLTVGFWRGFAEYLLQLKDPKSSETEPKKRFTKPDTVKQYISNSAGNQTEREEK